MKITLYIYCICTIFIQRSVREPKRTVMDDSSYRLNFDLGKKNKIHHHS
jgi:hypothetical protein